MKIFLSLSLLIMLSGCSERNMSKDIIENVGKFNDFYNSASDDNSKTIVYPESRLKPEISVRKNIKANHITLKDLVDILKQSYHVNINYSDYAKEDENTKNIGKSQKTPKSKKALAQANKGDISLSMDNVSLSEVFDVLIENYNIHVKRTSYGYSISPKQLITQTFVVDYHNFYRKGTSTIKINDSKLKDAGDSSGSHSTITSASEETFWSSIEKTIRNILSRNQVSNIEESGNKSATKDTVNDTTKAEDNFYVYKESGLIVVTAYPRDLKYIAEFLSKVNGNSVKQVLIETKILEIELLDQFSNGLQWDLLQNQLFYTSFTQPGQALGALKTLHQKYIPMVGSADPIQPGFLGFKGVNPNGFSLITQALAVQGNVSLVSTSRVSSLNNQRALIKAGDEQYYVTNVSSQTQPATVANGAAVTQSSFDIEPFFSGMSLDVTPHIMQDNQVLLHIHPMISRVEKDELTVTVGKDTTVLPAAKVVSREADTVVRSFSGDIIILGGMGNDLVQSMKSGLPIKHTDTFLDKVTNALSSKSSKNRRREMIILIKPTIVDSYSNFKDRGTFDLDEKFVRCRETECESGCIK